MTRDFAIDLNTKKKKCGCKNGKHTAACKKFSTDAKKAANRAIAQSTQNKNV